MPVDRNTEAGSPVVELEFQVTGPSHPFVAASEAEQCQFELQEMIPRGDDGRYAEFFSVTDADPDRILAITDNHSATVQLLREYENGGLFEFSVAENCPAVTLAELGALPRVVRGVRGEGRILGELPPGSDLTDVVESFLDRYSDAEFVAKREKEHPTTMFNYDGVRQAVRDRLTDRQHEVLRAAYEAGYYEWPRECTGQEVAESLDIASTTFSQHIQAAERKILAIIFGSTSASSPDGQTAESS